jgi:hypothetical protein
MADKIINEINKFKTFKFDKQNNRVINLKSYEDTDIDEFLEIQFILDNNYIQREYAQNFEIQIIK